MRHCFGRFVGRGLAPAGFSGFRPHPTRAACQKIFCHPERSEGSRILWLRRPIHGILHRRAVQNDRWIVKWCTQDGVAALFWETCRAGACSRRFLASDRIQHGRFVKRPYFRTPIPIRRGDSRIARLPQYRLPAMSNTGRLPKNFVILNGVKDPVFCGFGGLFTGFFTAVRFRMTGGL